jgi:hypothetical protein
MIDPGLPSRLRGLALALAAAQLAACAGARVGPGRPAPGDAWGNAEAALRARRDVDPVSEAGHLAAAAAAAPGDPVAAVAYRRLAALAEESPALAAQVDAAASAALASGRLAGLAAYRARVVRISAAEATGALDRAVALRAETGAVSAWSLAGPFGRYHALDFDTPYAPERGEWPSSVEAPAGLPPRPARPLPAPSGIASLEGEPADGDVFYLAADVELSRGGAYLLAVGSTASVKLLVDGKVVAERRAFDGHPATLQHVSADLAAGSHRVLAKVTRGPEPRALLHVAFARADGAPSDASARPAAPGPAPAARPPGRAVPVASARDLAGALARGGEAGQVLAALDAAETDREAAKALLAAALAARPGSPALLALRAEVSAEDPTLDVQAARGSAEADLRRVLEADPADARSRLALATIQRTSERLDDAEETLAALPEAATTRPAALASRARLALARGLAERASALAARALAEGGGCEALALSADAASRRGAVAALDEATRALASCPGGRARLAEHLSRRGDPRGAIEALAPVALANPTAIEPALALAAARVAAGDVAGAAAGLEALRTLWPRSAQLALRLADVRELSGDAAAARSLRNQALLLDGADLRLRRALALEDGTEVLAAEALDGRAAIRAYEAARPEGETSTVLVLDAAALELYPGATATERTHQVVHVLDQQGVEQFGEITVPDGAEVLALRTLKRDGRVLEPDASAGGKDSVSLAGLEPGDYVELDWVRAVRGRGHGGARGDGLAADPFYFQVSGTPLFRSVYAVLAPRGGGLVADAHHMDAPEIRVEGDREVVRAERTRVPALVAEPGAPGGQEYLPFVQVGVGGGREAMQRALADGVAERVRPTEEIRAYAARVRADAGASAGPEALVRAAYARVARDVLGQGSALGDDASEVLSRGRGSRAVVLAAVLGALGIEARFALARPYSADPAPYRFPSPAQWAAVLLRVRAGGRVLWLDPGLRRTPFGVIPAVALDCDALVLPAPGEQPEVVRTPPAVTPSDAHDVELTVSLGADGGAEVAGVERYLGHAGAAAKGSIERLDADGRRRMIDGMLSRNFRGIAVESFAIEGEDDPEAPLTLRWRGRVGGLSRASADGTLLVETPLLPFRLAPEYVQIASRRTPLLIATADRSVQRVRVVPPPGLSLRAGPPVALQDRHGRYARTERIEAGALVREERLEIDRGRVAPEEYPGLAAFAAAVDEAQEAPLRVSP